MVVRTATADLIATVDAYDRFSPDVFAGWLPRELPADPAGWCGQNVFFPQLSSATPGLFDIDSYPYQREILEVFCDARVYFRV